MTRGKYRKYGKAFLTISSISYDNLKLVGNMGNIGKPLPFSILIWSGMLRAGFVYVELRVVLISPK